MPRWAMVIDLTRCNGCAGCHAACKAENGTPPGVTFARVNLLETGSYPNAGRIPFPLLCMHCEAPECERVCPTGATFRRPDGIVTVDGHRCIGCKSCMLACPYDARYFYGEPATYFPGYTTPFEAVKYQRHRAGTVLKCNFCAGRIDDGLARGLTPGVDRAATPACVINCWCNARFFGDLDDPDSMVARMVGSGQAIQLHPEHGTNPRVFYLAPACASMSHLLTEEDVR